MDKIKETLLKRLSRDEQRRALVEVARLCTQTIHRYASDGALNKCMVHPTTLELLRADGLIHSAGSKIGAQGFGYRVTGKGWQFMERKMKEGA